MRNETPVEMGAMRPWRSAPNRKAIKTALYQADYEEIEALIRGAAKVVRAGRESPRWWYPGNLLGDTTRPMWLSAIAQLEADERAEAQRETAEARADARSEPEPEGPRMTSESMAAMLGSAGIDRWGSEE